MRISEQSLRGYVLEEVLAYLIRNTGYRLLVDPGQDPRDLAWRGNGLVVKGRGSVHQVDVLGQLEWIPAFTFPLRLFVEAKFRGSRLGIGAVRNAVGTLLDVNQNNSPTREQETPPQKYQYVYALFSTSGFSKSATEMALAHQISLIDLSGEEYRELRNIITISCGNIVGRLVESGTGGKDDSDLDEGMDSNEVSTIGNIRRYLRTWLQTLPEDVDYPAVNHLGGIDGFLRPIIEKTREYDQLFVAMANGPYMLLMKADNPQRFLEYAQERPRHSIMIRWSLQLDSGGTWEVIPSDSSDAYKLSFKLPEALYKWIFQAPLHRRKRALETKARYFRTITIYRHIDGTDYLFRLEYDTESTQRSFPL